VRSTGFSGRYGTPEKEEAEKVDKLEKGKWEDGEGERGIQEKRLGGLLSEEPNTVTTGAWGKTGRAD